MKIALDAMGGDHAPAVNLLGAHAALRDFADISRLFLVGDQTALEAGLKHHAINDPRLTVVHAPEVIGMAEAGAKAVRRKKHSSISIAMDQRLVLSRPTRAMLLWLLTSASRMGSGS